MPWLVILLKSFGRTANDWWLKSIPAISDCGIFLLDYKWLVICTFSCILLAVAYQTHLLRIEISDSKKLKDCIDIGICIPESHRISGEVYWIFCGIVSIVGTAAVGFSLSYMIRPFFILRYLFPVSAVLYLIIGVCVSKMKLRKLWSVALVLAILCSNVPEYAQTYREDRSLNNETAKFLNEVNPESNVELVTNNSHLGWTLLSYYYPENNSKYNTNAPESLDMDYEDIWLIWDGELDETDENNIKKQSFTFAKDYEGVFADGVHYHVYKLHRNG